MNPWHEYHLHAYPDGLDEWSDCLVTGLTLQEALNHPLAWGAEAMSKNVRVIMAMVCRAERGEAQ